MSVLLSTRATNYPDPRFGTFFDDFFSDLYDNQVWSIIGTGTVVMQSVNGGVARLRVTTGNTAEFQQANIGSFSVASDFAVEWRASLRPSADGTTECGMEGAGDQANNWICWQRTGAGANFLCQTGSSAGTTTTDSGIAADSAYHLFKIVGSAGVIQFFLDDVLCATITTYITASQLQPYLWNVGGSGTSDIFADYVLATGDRA
jgi:hypothetical protein